jgi:type VI secretion system VgrG family protein
MAGAFEFSIDGAPEKFTVVELRGKERMNKPYSFELVLIGRSIGAQAVEAHLLGQAGHLHIAQAAETERWVHGIVVAFEREGVSGHDADKHRYRARIEPAFRLLGESRQSRIFQDETVREIVANVLGGGGVRHAFRLAGTYRPRTYCVQYRESDQRFVERLLREEGMFYWFEQPHGEDEAEIMVIADAASAAPIVDGPEKLRFRDSSGMDERAEDVRRFRLVHRIEPSRALLKDFDFMRPSFEVSAEATRDDLSAAAPLEDALRGAGAGEIVDRARDVVRFVGGAQRAAEEVRSVAENPERAMREAARRARRAAAERLRSALPGDVREAVSAAAGVLGLHEIAEPADVPRPDEIERFDHHGELEGGRVDARLARTHLEQYRRRALLGFGES